VSLDACAELVAKGDPERWLSLMAGPVPARARLLPLYAFNLEVARAPWVSREPQIGQMRLEWWRDVLSEIAAGGPVRRHEVATPLAEILSPGAAWALDGLVEARYWDLNREPFETTAALTAHLEATGGRLLLTAAELLGAEGDKAALMDAGYAGALAAWLRAVPELTARGCQPLPAGWEALASEALGRLARARAAGIDPAARPALLALWQAGPVLKRAAADPARVADGRLELSPARAKAGLIRRQITGGW